MCNTNDKNINIRVEGKCVKAMGGPVEGRTRAIEPVSPGQAGSAVEGGRGEGRGVRETRDW